MTDRVQVRIATLAAPGLTRPAARRVADALAGELDRLVRDRGVPDAWRAGGRVDTLDLPAPASRPARCPEDLGREVATLLYDHAAGRESR